MNLDELLSAPVEPTTKGWPALAGALPLRDAGRQRWNLLRQDLPLPVAVLKASALAHNSRWMRGFLERFDVRLCPHGKTTMAPQLFARQLADGAFGITVATVQQLMVCRRFGVPRVLLANQLIGRQAIRTVIAELEADPTFEFLGVVDSLAGVAALRQELADHPLGRPVEVLLEGGVAGGRTGCRSLEEAIALARAVAAAPELALVGVEGFEDVMGVGIKRRRAPGRGFSRISGRDRARLCPGESVRAGAGDPERRRLEAFRPGDQHLPGRRARPAGRGPAAQRLLFQPRFQGLHRSLRPPRRTHARGRQELGEGLRPALELWAIVQSTPEPGLAVATLGKRDVGQDLGLPLALGWYRPGLHQRPQDLGPGFEVTGLYDQHACLRVPPDSPLQVGDLLSFGISHPCTTFDKWRLLYVVDDDYTVTEAIRTFF